MDRARGPASIAAVGLVKDEADIIGATLEHLHRIGIRRFVIADNGSTDATPQIVRRFAADHPDVTLVPLHDLFDLVASPQPNRKDLDRFARRFRVDANLFCYFQDFFERRTPIAFRLPRPGEAGVSNELKRA